MIDYSHSAFFTIDEDDMAQIGNIIFNVISPIFLVIGAAILIGRWKKPDPRTLSTYLVYLFSPALVFRGFATLDLHAPSVTGIVQMAIIIPILMMAIGVLMSRFFLRGWKDDRKSAFVLCLFMLNAANYGIPLNKFAFGDAAEPLALLFYAVQIVPGNIMGVYFASRGAVSAREAVMNVLRVPLTYAALAGVLVNMGVLQPPVPVMRALVDIAANASIPLMLALLGLKLAETRVRGMLRPVLLATGLRLILAPCIAVPLALLLGLTGLPFKVAVVQSAVPTAVLASALTAEFGSDSDYTSAVILVSTVLSVLTLSVLITILG